MGEKWIYLRVPRREGVLGDPRLAAWQNADAEVNSLVSQITTLGDKNARLHGIALGALRTLCERAHYTGDAIAEDEASEAIRALEES